MAEIFSGGSLICDKVRVLKRESTTLNGERFWEGDLELPPKNYLTGNRTHAEYILVTDDGSRFGIQILRESFSITSDGSESPVRASFRSSVPYDLPSRQRRRR